MRKSFPLISKARVGFVSDIEGDLRFWNRYIGISEVLSRASEDSPVVLRDDCHFVYGGDVCDRGPWDRRVTRDLLRLKEAYPTRVHLILGNRDLNKIRLTHELHAERLAQTPEVFWIKGEENTLETYLTTRHLSDSLVNRLKWTLDHTMGCIGTFEFRRQELVAEGMEGTDEEVLESYLSSLRPGGDHARYIGAGQLAVVLGDCLFVHGSASNPGYFPVTKESGLRHTDSLQEWIVGLNTFAEQELDNWRENPKGDEFPWSRTGGFGRGSGAGLCQYAMGLGSVVEPSHKDATVVYSDWLDHERLPCPVKVAKGSDYLNRAGIKAVFSGHQPFGDTPMVFKGNDLTVVSADTSYGGNVVWPHDCAKGSKRGDSVSSVTIEIEDGKCVGINVEAVLGRGLGELSYKTSDQYIGRRTKDRHLVVGRFKGSQTYMLTQPNGYIVSSKSVSEDDLVELLQ